MPEVWVQLVDDDSGAPFMDTDPASIPLTEEDHVGSLRDMVFDAYQGVLGDISPYNLKLYGNAKMQELLNPATQIGSLGGKLETAVIVKVSSLTRSSKRRQPAGEVAVKTAKQMKAKLPVMEDKFRRLFSSNQGIDGNFETQRTLTVKKFYRLLFPDDGSLGLPVTSVRAPPMSGKTDMCRLLNNYIVANNPQLLVAHVNAYDMQLALSASLDNQYNSDMFTTFFKRQVGWKFGSFCANSREKVVLIDEAERTYRDAHFSGGHIGIAHAMLRFLRLRLGHALHTIKASSLCVELHSRDSLVHLGSFKRGMPTAEAVKFMAKSARLPEAKVAGVLNEVALGRTVHASDMDTEKNQLTRFGFVYEGESRRLRLASDVHKKLWVYSSQKH